MPSQFDINGLKNQYSSNRVVRDIISFLSHLDERAKTQSVIEVDRLQEGMETGGVANRNLIINGLRNLEQTGIGRLVVGRKGKKSRFESAVPFSQLAYIAENLAGDVAPFDGSAGGAASGSYKKTSSMVNDTFEELSDRAKVTPAKKNVEIRFEIAPDFIVTATVPETLSRNEAMKFAEFIKSLPFDSSVDPEV
jgi:hypothetical protein